MPFLKMDVAILDSTSLLLDAITPSTEMAVTQ